jgi:thiosulfate reductase cytochrome b subunit
MAVAIDPAESRLAGGLAPRLHPLPVRIMHWLNAVAMIIMIGSGFGIYNDEIIFGWLKFPHALTLGLWAPGHLAWHFAGMWLLVLNGLAYVTYGVATGRFRRKLLPIRLRELGAVIRDTLRFRLGHDDVTVYNAVQKSLYIGVLLAGAVQVISGIAIWKPMQFPWLTALFYDFQGARLAHFIGMAAIVGFLVVHVALALLVPKTLVAMVTGGPRVPEPAPDLLQAAKG